MLFQPRFFKKCEWNETTYSKNIQSLKAKPKVPIWTVKDPWTASTTTSHVGPHKFLKPQGTKQAFTACCADKVAVSCHKTKELNGVEAQPSGKTTMKPMVNQQKTCFVPSNSEFCDLFGMEMDGKWIRDSSNGELRDLQRSGVKLAQFWSTWWFDDFKPTTTPETITFGFPQKNGGF